MKLLLDNPYHARKRWTKGICNAINGLREIIDHGEEHLTIPWMGRNSSGDQILIGEEEESPKNPPRI
jgi:hypothetical protein